MRDFLPFVVIGLTTGSVYALAATGLVLTYKTSRIFNFALGSMATVGVLLFYVLAFRARVPWQLAAVLTTLVLGPALGVGFEVLGRRLTPLHTEAKVLATIGLFVVIDGAVLLWGQDVFGDRPPSVQPSLPGGLIRVFGVNVGEDQIIIMAVSLVVAIALQLVLQHTRLGSAMRGVVDDPGLLALTGMNPRSVLRASWAIGLSFICLAGLLLVLSPSNTVSFGLLGLLILQAFGAAAIGGFSSLPWAYLGGLLVGIASAIATKYTVEVSWLGGIPPSIPFLVLFFVLVLAPRRLVSEQSAEVVGSRPRIVVPRFWGYATGLVVVAALVAVPLSESVLLVYSANEALAYAVIFLGLSLLIRTSGQVSLCQMGLAAVGAAIFAHLAASFGVPWFAAVLLGGVGAAMVGALVAIPAIRVAGIYLAVATFGFGVLLAQLFYATPLFFPANTIHVARPILGPFDAGDDVTFYGFALAFVCVATILIMAIRRARLGRLLRALGDSPRALQTQGTSINITKVAVFCISAFLAGIGGSLLVSQLRFLDSSPFSSTSSLTVVVILLTLRFWEPLSSLAAAAAMVIAPAYLSARAQVWWVDIGFGGAAVFVATFGSATWVPRWQWAPAAPRSWGLRSHLRPRTPVPGGVVHSARFRGELSATKEELGIEIRDLSVHFKEVLAVDHLTIRAPMGEITGLIGPNGAGKTTTFDFCSGLVSSFTGRLFLHGTDLTKLSAPARARKGLGRTFQRADLFTSLSIRQNVELGAEGAMAGGHPLAHLLSPPSQARAVYRAADEAIELVGIGGLLERDIGTLTTGEKRLVELARCLAGAFDILLLDEPSSGLDQTETQAFGVVLQRVVRDRGVGVLLVEHDMSLVMGVCTRLLVLDFGRLIFSGPPEHANRDKGVRAAYLGNDHAG